MKVFVIGQGGREHALAWKLSQSKNVEKVFCAPGNAGTQAIGENINIAVKDTRALIDFAKENQIDLTVVGPEAPLTEGIVDQFEKEGLSVFGPDQYASQLEGSKEFSKNLMKKLNVPTADYEVFENAEEAIQYLEKASYPIVVKADGLAAGKGVTIAQDLSAAKQAVLDAMDHKVFGDAGSRVVIEEYLDGVEASLIAIADGKRIKLLASSQDHKRIFDNDKGPNTGGMGAYSPAPMVSRQMEAEAEQTIFLPIIQEMEKSGHPFKGFLYAGIMITSSGMKVLEFNVRFGDPEAQAVLPRLKTDFAELIQKAGAGQLDQVEMKWNKDACVAVVLASKGYPASSSKGDVIQGTDALKNISDVQVFHAGTAIKDGNLFTDGGRVLAVVAEAKDIASSVEKVYQAVDQIKFSGMQFRKDIAAKAMSENYKTKVGI